MRNIILYSSLLLIGFASCMDDDAPSAALNVSLDKVEYRVGETVTFKFDGNPDNIVFYSGENGHNYAMKDRLYADNDLMVDFVLYTDQVTAVHPNFQVKVSNDFNGIYDVENVNAATWVDISDQYTFPTTVKLNTSSGIQNLKSYAGERDDAKLYIAFRYFDLGEPQTNRWVVRSINVDKISPEGVKTGLAVMSTAGWREVSISGAPTVWSISTAQLLSAGKKGQENDDWVITKGFDVKTSVPDTGVALKNISTKMNEYQYVYTKPGTYKAVFATSSEWYSGTKRSLTEVIVEVKE
ncbi:DUF5017 domain-containing protein [uncultured Bacteroides sp.]|uniref:DUF5017 domain-containing protein n=1 Tax=uncultured Bacteroides sp. TaxID=162156 RepID=UPI002675A393|nr:DUF5017 domain-containing protein [uncultured Bacteroides sp.]